MELYEFAQTIGALSGLICLTILLLTGKKKIKTYIL